MAKHLSSTGNLEQAETVALQGLTFLLGEPRHLERFLSETGLSPDEIRTNAGAREVLEAALTVLVQDEALLLTFAANAGLSPQDVVQAHVQLATDGGRLRPQSSI
ncbi:MAG: DUF3572 domain-containing protein [Hyphomicrobiaceae bacterium]